MLLAARHGFVLSCFCCCMDCWADFLLGVCYGLFILVSWLPCCCMHCDMLLDVASWIVICCLVYVMDCLSWFLGCQVVTWIVICRLVCVCVMDCVSCFLGRCVTCGLVFMFSCCVVAWIVTLFDWFVSWIVHHGHPESHGL